MVTTRMTTITIITGKSSAFAPAQSFVSIKRRMIAEIFSMKMEGEMLPRE